MRTFISIITTLLIFVACQKGGGDSGSAQFPLSLHYVDSTDKDLFSTFNDGQNGYWIDSVKAYDFSNGKKTMLSGYPNGVQFENLNVFRTDIAVNRNFTDHYSTTIIHLKHYVDDTLIIHINERSYSLTANSDTIWYNGIQVFYGSDTGTIRIVKSLVSR